jgi:ribonuclease-3
MRAGMGSSERTPGTPAEEEALLRLEAALGLPVTDRGAALAALTHKSYVNEHRGEALADNERLEFLGDAVIDLAVSHRLMERFPGAREGELSKMRAGVVDEQGLCAMARALGLGQLLRLGRGEELTGGREKSSLLADAMEAVIAAVYLGSGLGPVLAIVDRFLGEAFARASSGTLDRDWKTQLQELSQSRLRATPRYRVVAEHGPDHEKVFEVETDVKGEVVGKGRGRSKKDAEQAAARLGLDALARRFGGDAAGEVPGAAVEASPHLAAPATPGAAHAAPAAAPGDEAGALAAAPEPTPVAPPGPAGEVEAEPEAEPEAAASPATRDGAGPAPAPPRKRATRSRAVAPRRKPAAKPARKAAGKGRGAKRPARKDGARGKR